MFFAAKQAAERKAQERQERARQEGSIAGRQTERERISAALEQHGVQLTPELAKILAGDDK